MDQITHRGTTLVRGVQDDVAAEIRKMGANFNPEILAATRDLYLPLLKALDWDGIKIVSDIQYGDDQERNLLDVHVADDKPPAPVPVGGGIRGGGGTWAVAPLSQLEGLLAGGA